nr:Tn3 family transposase [Brucella grignonensis]
MADVSPGITMRQLAWAHDWHIREEDYTAAHAILVNAQRQLPLASLWGDGTTSSSDGQYFSAGGHAEAIGDLNARYDPNPGGQILSVHVRPIWRFLHCRHERQCQRGNLCSRRLALSWQ